MCEIETLAKQDGSSTTIRRIGGHIFLEDKNNPGDPVRVNLVTLSAAIELCPWMTDEDLSKVAKAFGEV